MSMSEHSAMGRARSIVAFWPVVGIPLVCGLLVAVIYQGRALQEQSDGLEADVAALHGQVAQVKAVVAEVENDLDAKRKPKGSGGNAGTARATAQKGGRQAAGSKPKAARQESVAQAAKPKARSGKAGNQRSRAKGAGASASPGSAE